MDVVEVDIVQKMCDTPKGEKLVFIYYDVVIFLKLSNQKQPFSINQNHQNLTILNPHNYSIIVSILVYETFRSFSYV